MLVRPKITEVSARARLSAAKCDFITWASWALVWILSALGVWLAIGPFLATWNHVKEPETVVQWILAGLSAPFEAMAWMQWTISLVGAFSAWLSAICAIFCALESRRAAARPLRN
jgi:hypothetical protein